jgi:hypothetical protein
MKDPEGASLTYTSTVSLSYVQFFPLNNSFVFTPPLTMSPGSNLISFSADDGVQNTTNEFTLNILNDPPIFQPLPTNQTVTTGILTNYMLPYA